MSGYLAVLLIAIAIYLFECIVWIPRRAYVFRTRGDGPWGTAPEIVTFFTGRWRAVMGDWIPGAGGIAICEGSVPALSPTGICACARDDESARSRTGFIPFAELGPIEAEGTHIRSGSRIIARTASATYARHLAATIEQLRGASEERRAALLGDELDRLLDTRAARHQLARYRLGVRSLDWIGQLLALAIFVILPATLALVGIVALVWAIGLVWLLSLGAVAAFAWMCRRLAPGSTSWRGHALTMILTPVAAIRAGDFIARDLFCRFHALALARVACSEAEAKELVGRAWRRLAYPLDSDPPCCEAAAWSRERWSARLRDWVTQAYGSVAELTVAPQRESALCVAFCPRCHQQYQQDVGSCPDCPGVTLRRFDPSGAQAAVPAG